MREGDIFKDTVSGAKSVRPGLDQCLQHLETGDTVMVWRLDRLQIDLRWSYRHYHCLRRVDL